MSDARCFMNHGAAGRSAGDACRRLITAAAWFLAAAVLPSTLHAQVACGGTLTQDAILSEDLSCPGDGLRLGAHGITLDCAGHSILGPGRERTFGISATGVEKVTVRNCHLRGFWTLVYLKDSPGALIEKNSIVGDPVGTLRATGSPNLRVLGNRFVGPGANSLIAYSPETLASDNSFDHASNELGEFISFSLYGSPRSRFVRNGSAGRTYVSLTNQSDGSVASDNRLLGGSQISIGHSTGSVITRNQLGPVHPAELYAGSAVNLYGAAGNEVTHNTIEGHRIRGIYVAGDYDSPPGSDSNLIQGNSISDAGIGLTITAGSWNQILDNGIRESWVGIEVLDFTGGTRTRGNVFERNTVIGGEYGVFAVFAGGNIFSGNLFQEQVWGSFDLQSDPAGREPNIYVENTIEGSELFGLLAWGTSPRLLGNRFLSNGSDSYVPVDPIDELVLERLGGLRGGVAFLPYVGDTEVTTLDDGDPSSDVLASPLVGTADQPNFFSGNLDVDVYALDCLAENADTLEQENQFEPGRGRSETGEPSSRHHARIRQDWFGLVRVEDGAGTGVAGAAVEIRDARGNLARIVTTGPTGFAPEAQDPDRTQGLFDGEAGGPVPAWPRFTQYVVWEIVGREDLTPHHIKVRSAPGMGRNRFTWDGIDNDPLAFRIVGGRYQTALVVLDDRRPERP